MVSSRGELMALYIQEEIEPTTRSVPPAQSRRAVDQLDVKVLVAERLEGSAFSRLRSATTLRRAGAAGGAAAVLLFGSLMFLTGVGTAAAEDPERDIRWERGNQRGAIDFDAEGFPIQFAPDTTVILEKRDWTPIERVFAGRTYRLQGEGVFETRVGGRLNRFQRVGFVNAKVADVVLVRTTDEKTTAIAFKDLGPTESLTQETMQEIDLHRLVPRPPDAK